MPLSDLDDTAGQVLHRAGLALTDMLTPTLRLGVTGLSRAGKTVFITALIRNLVSGGISAGAITVTRGTIGSSHRRR